MSTFIRKIRTRSQSAASTQANILNNQRPPEKGECVRVRLKSSNLLNNIKTNGWVSLKVLEVYKAESDQEALRTYIMKGHTEDNQVLQVQLEHNLDEEHLDLRARSGWDIAQIDNTNDNQHQERLNNPNHEDNLTITQRLLTIEEYKELVNEAEDLSAKNTGNDYEIPTNIKAYPSCPSSISEHETEKLSTTKYECLGETLHDNMQSIIKKCNLPTDITINEIHEAMAAEKSLIDFTNNMQDFILCDDWIENDRKSQMYVTMRQEWVAIANVYKHKREECEEKLANIVYNTDTNENLRKYAKNIYDQLTSNENKF